MQKWILYVTLLLSFNTQAAPSPLVKGDGKSSNSLKIFKGGVAGIGFSLKNVQTLRLKDRERIIIDIGDLRGGALKGLPGYFHAEWNQQKSQLVIDFSQMPKSFLDSQQLFNKLKTNKWLANSKLLFDPIGSEMTMQLDFKKNKSVKVYQVAGEKITSRVVVDIFENAPDAN